MSFANGKFETAVAQYLNGNGCFFFADHTAALMYSLPVLNTVFVLKPDLYGRRRIIDLETMLVKTIDTMLLERLANADYSAFDEIYEQHWSTLLQIAIRKVGDVDVAMDVVQDLFVDLWQRRYTINIHSGLRAYLISALYHKLFQHFRREGVHQKHIEHYSLMIQDGLQDVFPIDGYEENYMDVLVAIEQSVVDMPDRMRVVFNLKYQRSLSNHEIAEQLGISLQTVKNQLSKALTLVRQHMQQQQLNPTVFLSLSFLLFF